MRSNPRKKEAEKRLREMAPQISMADFLAVIKTADAGHLRHLPVSIALKQALTSRARHQHTDYDALLEDGYDQESARHFVLDETNEVLASWGCAHQISPDSDG